MKIKWECIWESDIYKAAIYDNCTTRIYQVDGKIKVEEDTTKWVDNTGSFDVKKTFCAGAAAQKIINAVVEYDADQASETDVLRAVGLGYY